MVWGSLWSRACRPIAKTLAGFLRGFMLSSAAALVLLAPGVVSAQTVHFDIPSEPLADALRAFAAQSHMQLLYSSDTVSSKTSSPVSGDLDAHAALEQLLRGTGLEVAYTSSSAATIRVPAVATAVQFDIPAADLATALTAFQTQAHVHVTYSAKLIKGKRSHAVSGSYTPTEALRQLLSSTGLSGEAVNGSSFRLMLPHGSDSASAVGPTEPGALPSERVLVAGAAVKAYEPGGNVDLPRTIDDTQPYYIFDSATIEQSGAINVEDFLKQFLTMNAETATNSQTNQAGGRTPLDTRSAIDLRGLGPDHTLILVDGRRMAGVSINGDGGNTQPDINGIPLAAIDRIEVLPSSASGIYGGNAVGGVINIILKKNYQGGDITINYGKPESSGASSRSIDGIYGFTLEGGKTHVMLSADYSDESPMTIRDRQDLVERGLSAYLKKCPDGSCLPGVSSGLPFPGGSDINLLMVAYEPPTYFPPQLTNLILANGTVLPYGLAHIAPGCIATKSLASCLQPGVDSSLAPGAGQYGLDQQLGAFSRVSSFAGTVSRDMLPWLTAFASVRLNEHVSESNSLAVSGLNAIDFLTQSPYFQIHSPPGSLGAVLEMGVPAGLLPAPEDTSYSATRTGTFGLTGRLPYNWNVEADYTWSKNVYDALGYFPDPTQIMLDWGGGVSNFTESATPGFPLLPPPPGATSKWVVPVSSNNSATVNDVALRGTGPIGHLPWGDPTLAFGLDVERDAIPESIEEYAYLTSASPTKVQAFDAAIGCPSCFDPYVFSAHSPTIYFPQTQTTASLYAEANIPLITEQNAIPAVQGLAVQVTDRLERYTVFTGTSEEQIDDDAAQPIITYTPTPANANSDGTGGTPTRTETTYQVNTKTFGLKWDPIKDVFVRGSLATAFLPPTYSDLLTNPQICVSCAYIPSGGYLANSTTGGNPNLKPETSRSIDAGIVYEPKGGSLDGLRVDWEHYRITQYDAIVGPLVSDILANPAFASRVTRNAQGQITLINLTLINAPELKTQGNDISLRYHAPVSVGVLDLRLVGSAIQFEDRQLCVTCQLLDYAGWADDGGEAKYKANGSLQWSWRNWTLGWTTRWYGRTNVPGAPGDPAGTLIGPGTTSYYQGSYFIPAQSYHDLLVSYSWDSHAGAVLANSKVQLLVTDVLNQVPPLDTYNAPFFYSPLGDIRLRTFQLSFKKSF